MSIFEDLAPGTLLLWRKKDNTKIYVLDNLRTDVANLIPTQWSCILFWNTNGTAPIPVPAGDDVPMPQAYDHQPPMCPMIILLIIHLGYILTYLWMIHQIHLIQLSHKHTITTGAT